MILALVSVLTLTLQKILVGDVQIARERKSCLRTHLNPAVDQSTNLSEEHSGKN